MSRELRKHIESMTREHFGCDDISGWSMEDLAEQTGISHEGLRRKIEDEFGDIFGDKFGRCDTDELMCLINRHIGKRPSARFRRIIIDFDLGGKHCVHSVFPEDFDPYADQDSWLCNFEIDGIKLELYGDRDDNRDRLLPEPYMLMRQISGDDYESAEFHYQVVYGQFVEYDEYESRIKNAASAQELRYILIDLEKQIKAKCKNFNRQELTEMLHLRNGILNRMFMGTEQEVARFKEQNELLDAKSRKLHERAGALYRRYLASGRDGEFDKDVEVEGRLFASIGAGWYDDDEPWDYVVSLNNDDYYGSDFSMIMPLIENICDDDYSKYIELVRINHDEKHTPESSDEELMWIDAEIFNNKDENWAVEYPLRDRPSLNGINVCHATHKVCCHTPFSIPDFLRIKNFDSEVQLLCQDF